MATIITKFRSESINGISFAVYKSAIQKFVRRDECKKGLTVLKILRNFEKDEKNGKKLVSNIINRLVVMMSEEISINNALLPVKFRKMYEEFEKGRNYEIIYKMYVELCLSRKCRLLSDLKAAYINKGKEIEELEIEDLLKLIEKNIKKYDVFIYISYYLNKEFSIQKLWKLIIKCTNAENVEIITSLKYFYTKMTHKEKKLYLFQSILTIINWDELRKEKESIEESVVSMEEFEEFSGNFPDYVYDMHTGNKKKNRTDFVNEGAYIVNECTKYKNEEWRKMYIEGKKKKEDVVVEELSIEYFSECVRGQKLTSSSKPFVFIVTDNKYGEDKVGYVFKGPYDKNNRRNKTITWRIDILKSIGTKYVLLPDKIKQGENDWFRYKYIGSINKVCYKEEHDNVSNTDVKILDRTNSGIIQFSKLKETQLFDAMFKEKMILTLVDLAIIGVGDVGFWNMIMNEESEKWVIDIEDTRGEINGSIEECFLSKTSKTNKELFKKGMKYEGIKDEIIEHLNKRKLENWNKWEKYFSFIKKDPNKIIDYMMTKIIEV
jgi:hypothetical protein